MNSTDPKNPVDPIPTLRQQPEADVEALRAGLRFYANRHHFDLADESAWDTVSGEPQNWWCDEAGTATIEDGSIAAMVLRGVLIDWTADGDVPPGAIEGEAALASRAPAQALGELPKPFAELHEPETDFEDGTWHRPLEQGWSGGTLVYSADQMRAALAHRATAQAPEQPVHLTERVGSLPGAADGGSGSGSAG